MDFNRAAGSCYRAADIFLYQGNHSYRSFLRTVYGAQKNRLLSIEKCHATKEKSVVASYAKRIIENKGNRPKIELLLSEYELDADKEIATSKVLAKMGPILGLMGTLIPMGPALVGLASGDIASMAYNMQVAFATTVVGLVVSAVGFVTQQMKERWAVANTTILEYLSDVIEQTSNSNAA